MSCYLDISFEEAFKRYQKENNYQGLETTYEQFLAYAKVIEFDDEFEAYDVWGK